MQLEHSFTVPVPVEQAWRALLDPGRVAPCFPGATLTSVSGDEFSGTVKVRMGPISLLYRGNGRFASTDEAARRLVLEASGKDSRGNGTASATVTAILAGDGESTTVGVVTDLTITGRPAQLGRGLIGEVGGKILDAFAACLATELAGAPGPAAAAGAAAAGTPAAATPITGTPATGTPATGTPATGAGQPGAASTGAGPAGGTATGAVAQASTRAAGNGSPPATTPSVGRDVASPAAPTPRPASAAEEIDLIGYAGRPVLKRLAPVATALLALFLVLRWLRRRG